MSHLPAIRVDPRRAHAVVAVPTGRNRGFRYHGKLIPMTNRQSPTFLGRRATELLATHRTWSRGFMRSFHGQDDDVRPIEWQGQPHALVEFAFNRRYGPSPGVMRLMPSRSWRSASAMPSSQLLRWTYARTQPAVALPRDRDQGGSGGPGCALRPVDGWRCARATRIEAGHTLMRAAHGDSLHEHVVEELARVEHWLAAPVAS